MGWGRTLLLGDVGNRMDIGDCENDISNLRRMLNQNSDLDRDQEKELRALRQEVDELKLCVGALTRMLTAHGVIDQSELARFAQLIDDDEIGE